MPALHLEVFINTDDRPYIYIRRDIKRMWAGFAIVNDIPKDGFIKSGMVEERLPCELHPAFSTKRKAAYGNRQEIGSEESGMDDDDDDDDDDDEEGMDGGGGKLCRVSTCTSTSFSIAFNWGVTMWDGRWRQCSTYRLMFIRDCNHA